MTQSSGSQVVPSHQQQQQGYQPSGGYSDQALGSIGESMEGLSIHHQQQGQGQMGGPAAAPLAIGAGVGGNANDGSSYDVTSYWGTPTRLSYSDGISLKEGHIVDPPSQTSYNGLSFQTSSTSNQQNGNIVGLQHNEPPPPSVRSGSGEDGSTSSTGMRKRGESIDIFLSTSPSQLDSDFLKFRNNASHEAIPPLSLDAYTNSTHSLHQQNHHLSSAGLVAPPGIEQNTGNGNGIPRTDSRSHMSGNNNTSSGTIPRTDSRNKLKHVRDSSPSPSCSVTGTSISSRSVSPSYVGGGAHDSSAAFGRRSSHPDHGGSGTTTMKRNQIQHGPIPAQNGQYQHQQTTTTHSSLRVPESDFVYNQHYRDEFTAPTNGSLGSSLSSYQQPQPSYSSSSRYQGGIGGGVEGDSSLYGLSGREQDQSRQHPSYASTTHRNQGFQNHHSYVPQQQQQQQFDNPNGTMNFSGGQTDNLSYEASSVPGQEAKPQQVFYVAVPTQDGQGQFLQPVQMVQVPGQPNAYVLPSNSHNQNMGPSPSSPGPHHSSTTPHNGDVHGMSASSSMNFMVPSSQGLRGHANLGGDIDNGSNQKKKNHRHYTHQNKNAGHYNNNMQRYGGGNAVGRKPSGGMGNQGLGSMAYEKHSHPVKSSSSVHSATEPRVMGFDNGYDDSHGRPLEESDVQRRDSASHVMSSSSLNSSNNDFVASLYASPQRPPLQDLLGHVRRLSRDQVGCRLLQQSLDEEGPNAATLILNEGLSFWGEAMVDPFGNYLFQKILEKITAEERIVLVRSVSSRLVNASLNLHGTRSVQKVVELCAIDEASQDSTGSAPSSSSETAADILTRSLSPAAARLCIDSHGNHVIQRILLKLPYKYAHFVFDAVATSVGDVARHRHGCCVIQRCLDSSPSTARSNLVARIVEKSLELMQDAYGNYVVQYVLDVCSDEDVHDVCESVVGKVNLLAIQKFSSNVMEKCLDRCTDKVRETYLAELSDQERIRELMMDPFGNYVIQRALAVATHAQALKLVDAMKPHLVSSEGNGGGIKNTAGGRRIMTKITRRFPNFSVGDELLIDGRGSADSQLPDSGRQEISTNRRRNNGASHSQMGNYVQNQNYTGRD